MTEVRPTYLVGLYHILPRSQGQNLGPGLLLALSAFGGGPTLLERLCAGGSSFFLASVAIDTVLPVLQMNIANSIFAFDFSFP